MTRMDNRRVLAPVLTGVLLLIMWTVPSWSGLTPAAPDVSLRVGPQLMGPGARPAPAAAAGYVVDVDVAGATAGNQVTLEVWSDGDWVVEDEGRTDSQGSVRLVSMIGAFGRILTEAEGERVTTPVDPVLAGPALWFSDEFDDAVLSDLWLGVPQPDDGETCTVSDERGVAVGSGVMSLRVEEDPDSLCKSTGQPSRLNGHLILRATLGYGTVAARIKFPRSRRVSGAFWLQPGDPGVPWVMDDRHEGVVIAQTAGTDEDPRLATAVNRVVDGAIQPLRRVASPVDATTDGKFHVYSVSWTPEAYTFQIDGETIRRVESASPLPPMTVGLAMLAPHNDLPPSPAMRAMDVDWLRVWAP